MKKPGVFLTILVLALSLSGQPLPVKSGYQLIIDTDCAIDDMRALAILLSRPGIRINAILVSDGSLPPGEGLAKVEALLHESGQTAVPTGCGETVSAINPPWRAFNSEISWGREPVDVENPENAAILLSRILKASDEKITVVCLGPLTNTWKTIEREPELASKIERIIWYNESVNPLKGFNYECDPVNAAKMLGAGIRTDVISNTGEGSLFFDRAFLDMSSVPGNPLSSLIYYVHSQKPVLEKISQNHFRLTDDLVAIYLLNPELFTVNTSREHLNVRYIASLDAAGVKEVYSDLLTGRYIAERNVVFNRFPAEREMFNYDVRPIIDQAITKYGPEEWKANVMTDEFHGHLGVFSIVGAKMGIRAREFFKVGPDELQVISFAGSKPPYSCLNDGIQVSTGATLGMGTISLSPEQVTRPSAIFTHKGRSVRITLKKEYLDQVEADINEGILKFGLADDGYWKLIRRNALRYWLEWDRNSIFELNEILTGSVDPD